jgi:ABC-2 type transport system ATP-binding protein
VETEAPTPTLHLLTDWALRHGAALADLTVDRPSLEDIYLRLTREGSGASAPAPAARPVLEGSSR